MKAVTLKELLKGISSDDVDVLVEGDDRDRDSSNKNR